MIYLPCDPYRILIILACDCQQHWQTDSDNLDFMARFDVSTDEDPTTEARLDQNAALYG